MIPLIRRRALLGVLAFFLSLLCACASPAGPVRRDASQLMTSPSELRAGFAEADITPPNGSSLAGYGGGARREAWPSLLGIGYIGRAAARLRQSILDDEVERRSYYLSGAVGAHDPLRARACVLRPENAPPFAVLRLDLVVVTHQIQDAILDRVRELGFTRDRLLVTANHTHSGCGGFHQELAAQLIGTDVFKSEIFELIVAGGAKAIRQAHERAEPAKLGLAQARDRSAFDGGFSKNRRSDRGLNQSVDARDPEVLALVLRARRDDEPILGVILNAAVHPTVLGPKNHYFSGDLAWGIENALEAALPGRPPVLFINGAEGDIGPNQEGLPHPGGLAACRTLGQRCADLISGPILEAPTRPKISIATAALERDFGGPFLYKCLGSRERFYEKSDDAASILSSLLLLPLDLPLWLLGVPEARFVLTWDLRLGFWMDLSAYAESTNFRASTTRIRLFDDQLQLQNELALLAIPGEATHDLGLLLKQESRTEGATATMILGLCNDSISYIASRDIYFEGGYEADATLFGPEASERLVEALREGLVLTRAAPLPPASAAPPSEAADNTPKKEAPREAVKDSGQ
jgi:hypothetical protein